MALLHFAFGKHFREGRLDDQIQETCQMILGPRKLRGGSCPEFLPQLTNAGSLWAVPGSGQLMPNGALTFPQMVASPKVGLLPCDKWMLCFTDIPFNKLANWPAIAHYGQLAIAFQKSFQTRLGIKRVQYYELNRLHTDRRVIAYNQAQGSKAVQELANELLMFRKPKKQWPEFRKLYGMTKISAGPSGVTSEVITYDRYPDGYEFSAEAEARMLVTEHNPYVDFEEADVFRIFAPSISARDKISKFLNENWTAPPCVELFPAGILAAQ